MRRTPVRLASAEPRSQYVLVAAPDDMSLLALPGPRSVYPRVGQRPNRRTASAFRSSRLGASMLTQPITDPRAWTATSVDDPRSWYYPLADACFAAFEQARRDL